MKTTFINFIIILFIIYTPFRTYASIGAVSVTLPDGELITYYRRGRLFAKQTSIKGLPKEMLMIVQLTDGKELVQAIYSEGRLADCDLSSRKVEAQQIQKEIKQVMKKNTQRQILNNNNNVTNNKTILINDQNNNNNNEWSNISLSSTDINVTTLNRNTLWRSSRRGGRLRWFDLTRLSRQCQALHERTISKIAKSRTRRALLSIKPSRHSRNKVSKSRRNHMAKGKKNHLKQKLISPGTKWCGPSNRAMRDNDLGGFWQTDRCCRRHDTCTLTIAPFSNKHSIVNTAPFTLSHCACDRRFRNCLKMADTGASNLVGKLFFNVVQTNCFVLKPEKVCTKRSWWGKCQKHEYKKLAHIRNNQSY